MMAGYDDDADDEPLFADDLDDFDDDDPPPLPAPITQRHINSPTRQHVSPSNDQDHDTVLTNRSIQQQTSRHGVTSEQQDSSNQQKKARRPLLTLKVDRLFTDKGLPYLSKEFPKLKFRGKGYEASDLKCLLKEYELWANIIYPKYTFKDFVRRVEALSTKSRQFKTEMKKMRYKSAGIPLPGEDDVLVTENEQITDHDELNISANPLDNNENDLLCKSSSLDVDIEEENREPWDDIANDIIPHDDDIYDKLYEDVGELLND